MVSQITNSKLFELELVTFLTTVMTSTLADLSPKAKGHLYFEAFDHLATTIKVIKDCPS